MDRRTTARIRMATRRSAIPGGLHPAIAVAICLLVIAQAADFVTFLVMIELHGLDAEVNPLVAAIAGHDVLWLSAAKAALVVYVASAFFIARLRRPRMAHLTLALGILVGAIGAASNIATL